MNGTPERKRDRVLVADLNPLSAAKTSATAEAGGKKRHFYRPLPKEFRRDGFQYRQIAREGDGAIYEQAWLGCAAPSRSYEVVRIRCREGFQIGNRFVSAAEVYPNSEAWGVDGFTFTDRNRVRAKFLKFRWKNQQRQERRGSRIEKVVPSICR